MQPKPHHLSAEYGAQFQDPAVAAVYRKRPPYVPETWDLILEQFPDAGPSVHRAVLEVGSGTGEIAIPLSARLERVDAIEPSDAMLAIARSTEGSERVRWHQTSAEEFEYSDTYDLIICAQCLAWLDWPTVFPRFASALKTEGLLIIVGQEALEELPWLPALKRIVARYSTNQHFQPFDLLDEIQSRGLFQIHSRQATAFQPFTQTIDDYVESIHARNGFSRDRMTAEAARAFDAEVIDLLNLHHPDGMIQGTNRSWITWGKPLPPAAPSHS